MTVFNGIVKIRVVEARDLRPTEWSKRFNNSDSQTPLLDTYVNVDCDEVHVGQTVTKPKTSTPVWNEDYKVRSFRFIIYPSKTMRRKIGPFK